MGLMSSKQNAEGNYDPSPFTLLMGTTSKTEYAKQTYDVTYSGTKPILVVCTDEGLMPMKNGKVFNTGNHPVEMLVPMLHFRDAGQHRHERAASRFTHCRLRRAKARAYSRLPPCDRAACCAAASRADSAPRLSNTQAGFTFDIATASGKPVVLEMWAFPNKDANVKSLHDELAPKLKSPKKLASIPNLDGYAAIFVPGGHGCMINLPSNVHLGKLLNMAHARALPTVTLCHGPSVYLATCLDGTGQAECAYKGYKTMCFTDKTDAFTPKVGYLPGPMPWKLQEAIEAKGVEVVNTSETGAATSDRELITGDSPYAANNLGILAAPLLVKFAVENKL